MTHELFSACASKLEDKGMSNKKNVLSVLSQNLIDSLSDMSKHRPRIEREPKHLGSQSVLNFFSLL